MFLMVVIEVFQLSKSFGTPLVNVTQLGVYLGTAIIYFVNLGKPEFQFGLFLRITAFFFVFSFLLEVIAFPRTIQEKKDKLLFVLLAGLKLFPLLWIIVYLTESYM